MESERKGHGEDLRLSNVKLKVLGENLEVLQEHQENLSLVSTCVDKSCKVVLYKGSEEVLVIAIAVTSQLYRAGLAVILMRLPHSSAVVTTSSSNDASRLLSHIEGVVVTEGKRSKQSAFSLRTEESSAKQYFQFYGYLSQQQNMLQDYVRTGTYQSAMLQNTSDFKGKVVLDVGAGTGVLSFFALQAGARRVYSIEASNIAVYCKKLVTENKFSDKMIVIIGKVEEVDVPEKVDMIISEPMGYMLFNERMLETYLHAKKWLKPGGNMFPTKGVLYIAPFNDEALYLEQFSKANFWNQKSFHGINVSSLRQEALEEYFKQPVLDTFDVRIVTAKPVGHTTNFLKTDETDLLKISIPLEYRMWSSGMVHGLAVWFDCAFCGSDVSVWLSTAPFQPLTHWYQIRLLLPKPLFLHKDEEMNGTLCLVANERQSYDVTVDLHIPGSGIKSHSSYDLKNPNFRYTSGTPPVPGMLHANPTDSYYHETPSQFLTSSASPYGNNHAPSSVPPTQHNQSTSPYPVPQTSLTMSNVSAPHLANPAALQNHAPSLNPAAPQFVPLPDQRPPLGSSSGILTTPSAGGVYQSSGLYMMGSQQMVYSHCPPGVGGTNVVYNSAAGGGGSGAGGGKYNFEGQGGEGGVHARPPYDLSVRNHYY